ncbi:hypothetical protein INT47_009810 [Mucor saturninus]|uniref:Uncharacterized protein n=1 Tax=Mucor saturninus TaxID=64648 RepID=A0A8H7QV82_9FUNG|nr:hypothetical protein INT47_009810 [Mucor saturninus]
MLPNSNRLGQRVEVKPSNLSAKNELIEASRIYFKSHNNVLKGGPVEMDDCELERLLCFNVVYLFKRFA